MTQRRIYQDEYPYFVTARTRDNYLLFEKTGIADLLSRIMFHAARIKHFDIISYQIMPDHVHLMVYKTPDCTVLKHPIAATDLPAIRFAKAKQAGGPRSDIKFIPSAGLCACGGIHNHNRGKSI